jgi:hypothetical protein
LKFGKRGAGGPKPIEPGAAKGTPFALRLTYDANRPLEAFDYKTVFGFIVMVK